MLKAIKQITLAINLFIVSTPVLVIANVIGNVHAIDSLTGPAN
jgi:hypothetical protein